MPLRTCTDCHPLPISSPESEVERNEIQHSGGNAPDRLSGRGWHWRGGSSNRTAETADGISILLGVRERKKEQLMVLRRSAISGCTVSIIALAKQRVYARPFTPVRERARVLTGILVRLHRAHGANAHDADQSCIPTYFTKCKKKTKTKDKSDKSSCARSLVRTRVRWKLELNSNAANDAFANTRAKRERTKERRQKKKETAYASHGRVMFARSANLRRSTGKSGFRKRNAAETYDRAAGRWRV